ncbi:MAG: SUMF1/EgtB/PvdO family nonheme iron enzyme [Deltaproteobacteria bacterium]|nr:SUMF1/EgtB/PvdO family nonheme iron enzyme [Deltaproteobacteria bacterium]
MTRWPLLIFAPLAGFALMGCEPDPIADPDISYFCEEPGNANREYSERVLVEGGTFVMGADVEPHATSSWPSGDERPPHWVSVSPFCMNTYEVTLQQYEDCVREGACSPHGLTWEDPDDTSRDYETVHNHYPEECWGDEESCWDHPVNGKTYFQATDYCEWTGGRLCTEAEWEVAAKGPYSDRRDHPWGNATPTYDLTNIPSTGPGYVTPVHWHEDGASVDGIFNMAGNVYEWVYDGYELYPEADEDNPLIDPVVEPAGDDGVYVGRGSCFFTEPLRTTTQRTIWPAQFDWG